MRENDNKASNSSLNAVADRGANDVARQRLKWFALHLLVYFVVVIFLGGVNYISMPEEPWIVLPMVGWGSVLALHVAWVMGMFDIFMRKD